MTGGVKLAARLPWTASLRAIGAVLIFAGLQSVSAAATLAMPQLGPLVQVIDADERDDHVDISVQFSCSVRYISNTPMSRGTSTTITLRLGPDCGNLLMYFRRNCPWSAAVGSS